MKPRLLPFALIFLLASAALQADQTPTSADGTRMLTLDAAVQLALKQNPDIRKALQEIERSRGVTIEVQAEALPQATLTSNYSQQDRKLLGDTSSSTSSEPLTLTIPAASGDPKAKPQTLILGGGDTSSSFTSPDKSWRIALEGKQLLYAGGRVAAGIRSSKLSEDSSYYALRDTIDLVIQNVREQFYEVLQNRALITVEEESVRLLDSELSDQKTRLEAGTVPRFNVLRAEVELSNERPNLIRARNNYLTAKLRLAKTLGVNSDGRPGRAAVDADGELRIDDRKIDLGAALELARAHRPSLKVQRQNILIQVQQIHVAASGFLPTISATGGYEYQSTGVNNDLSNYVDGWFLGLQGSWDVFDGGATYGKVKQAKAQLESAKVNYDDAVRQVDLEVEESYARVQEARELITSQQKGIEQADEALRLARERLAAGAGTQLDFLDAQVALTKARVTELQARYEFNVALAEFQRVTATETQYAELFDDPLTRKYRRTERATAAKASPVPQASPSH